MTRKKLEHIMWGFQVVAAVAFAVLCFVALGIALLNSVTAR